MLQLEDINLQLITLQLLWLMQLINNSLALALSLFPLCLAQSGLSPKWIERREGDDGGLERPERCRRCDPLISFTYFRVTELNRGKALCRLTGRCYRGATLFFLVFVRVFSDLFYYRHHSPWEAALAFFSSFLHTIGRRALLSIIIIISYHQYTNNKRNGGGSFSEKVLDLGRCW